MATLGMEELDLLTCFILDNEPYRDVVGTVKIEHQKTCMETLEHQIKQDCELIIPNIDAPIRVNKAVLLGMMRMEKKKMMLMRWRN
jgi:hypothetical protein